MKKRSLLHVSTFAVFLVGLLASYDSLANGPGANAILEVEALNDRPGPVQVRIQGWDVRGDPTVDGVLTWDADDNMFSIEDTVIPKSTRVLRFTFINDFFIPSNPDTDRNAFIDYFVVNNVLYEAEDFDRTGGPDPLFPGCGVANLAGVSVADCGNQGDFVEYDLHPGNPVGPDPIGPGRRIGP
jgi:hypothetical protein